MSRDEILKILLEHKRYIQTNFEVEKIGLFGSYAKDTATTNSDIDIYVEFKNKTLTLNLIKNTRYIFIKLE